jgi:thioredoxin reductase
MNNEFVIIGAGPAGLCAALEASKYGVKVLLIDENDRPGGQLFLQTHKFFGSRHHMAGIRGYQIGNQLLEKAKEYGIELLLNTVVWGIFPDMRIAYNTEGEKKNFVFSDNILIATGALEKALYFEGWTKPGVMGAGAAQHMMHVHRVLPGKRVLVVGSGNVGLIVSYQLAQAGAQVVGVIDYLPKIGGYQVHAGKIRRLKIPILTSYTISQAKGSPAVQSAVIAKVTEDGGIVQGSELEVSCDLICLAVGLRPFDELCRAIGLDMVYVESLGGFIPKHNKDMETVFTGIYIAGDVAGIEEANTAMDEGRIVGIEVAAKLGRIERVKAEKLKSANRERLNHLRIGTFGDDRAKGKNILLQSLQ